MNATCNLALHHVAALYRIVCAAGLNSVFTWREKLPKENIKLYEGKKPPSLDIFLEFIGLKEDEFYKVLKEHEISPHKFDLKKTDNGKKVHDYDKWEKSGKMDREEALKILKNWEEKN